ncbi:hypothetical protein ACQCT3_17900 [Sutcliffiella horikoshii]|uniref:hypothetical protein n=1 Tax=Sutcliffiella horikoshii TaxID=79883 RepID=UPI003CF04299
MSDFSKYKYVETMKGRHCDIEIYVDENDDQKDYEDGVREYLLSLLKKSNSESR